MSNFLSLPIRKIHQLIQSKHISPKELCLMCLERIKKIKDLNAFITVTENVAIEQSNVAQEKIDKGNSSVLNGIPIAFKDNWSTQNILTTCASKMLSNYVPPYNATVVEKLVHKGTVIVGKTNLDEFAMGSATIDSYYGPTKNPWRYNLKYKVKKKSARESHNNLQIFKDDFEDVKIDPLKENDFFISGGSSGGAAVAVASGACFGAIGSDTGGSTRNPASFCGVVGLKPTYGLVSRNGLIPLNNTLDVPGIITRSVDDSAILLNAIAGPDRLDSTTVSKPFVPFELPENISIKNFKIGIPKEYECPGMSSEVIETWNAVRTLLEKSGATVQPVSLPHTKYSIMCYSVLCCCDVASNFARYDGIRYGHRAELNTTSAHHYAVTRSEGFGEVVRERILSGNYFLLKKNYEKYFMQAAKVRQLICKDFKAVFDSGIDLLLTPVTLTSAQPYSQWILKDNREHNAIDDFCTQPVNMAGLPAISFPCTLSKDYLPLSLQLIGKPFHEKQMLTAAKWLEKQLDFPYLHYEF